MANRFQGVIDDAREMSAALNELFDDMGRRLDEIGNVRVAPTVNLNVVSLLNGRPIAGQNTGDNVVAREGGPGGANIIARDGAPGGGVGVLASDGGPGSGNNVLASETAGNRLVGNAAAVAALQRRFPGILPEGVPGAAGGSVATSEDISDQTEQLVNVILLLVDALRETGPAAAASTLRRRIEERF